ncbi:MAG: hypothetical protein PHV68_02280 [Candidatus Gastranaerophilales bacterium]|nr:hypothetical protein [Candidatus Gastranaerophilales bacterium]
MVEYIVIFALVGLVAGVAFWNMTYKDPELFKNVFKSVFGGSDQVTETQNGFTLAPMDE